MAKKQSHKGRMYTSALEAITEAPADCFLNGNYLALQCGKREEVKVIHLYYPREFDSTKEYRLVLFGADDKVILSKREYGKYSRLGRLHTFLEEKRERRNLRTITMANILAYRGDKDDETIEKELEKMDKDIDQIFRKRKDLESKNIQE